MFNLSERLQAGEINILTDSKSKDNPENDGEDDLFGGRTGDFQILDELQQEP